MNEDQYLEYRTLSDECKSSDAESGAVHGESDSINTVEIITMDMLLKGKDMPGWKEQWNH